MGQIGQGSSATWKWLSKKIMASVVAVPWFRFLGEQAGLFWSTFVVTRDLESLKKKRKTKRERVSRKERRLS